MPNIHSFICNLHPVITHIILNVWFRVDRNVIREGWKRQTPNFFGHFSAYPSIVAQNKKQWHKYYTKTPQTYFSSMWNSDVVFLRPTQIFLRGIVHSSESKKETLFLLWAVYFKLEFKYNFVNLTKTNKRTMCITD